MIHVYNCAQGVCTLPARLCNECSRCCDKIDCKPCQNCCDQLGVACSNFMNKPLGTYVVVAVALSAVELFFCVSSLLRPELLATCLLPQDTFGPSLGIINWLYVQLGTAWLNLIFAPYIQHRLWWKLNEEQAEASVESNSPQPAAEITMGRVKESFRHVFLHDIGVCIYVFVLLFSFFWSYTGSDWLEVSPGPACNPDDFTAWAASLGMMFVLFVFMYTAIWTFYMECMTTMYVGRAPYARQRTSGQFMGTPYGPPAGHLQAGPHPTAPAGMFAGAAQQAFRGGGRKGSAGQPVYAYNPAPQALATQPYASEAPYSTPYGPGAGQPPPMSPLQRACTPGQVAKLLACLGLDLCGNATYFLPVLGEGFDVAYAPAQAVALKMLFSSNSVAGIGFFEELLPFTDILPTATVAWCLETLLPQHPFTRALGLAPQF
mmetsp:Transcript_65090/g.146807  ORF Transcript_65090/g.146807 Transcript_65090/m.146807 type:complete len:432 (-) Transcript_65090:134-1429(-)